MLRTFEKASGKKLNIDKSSVFFSKNTPESLKLALNQKLGFSEANERSLYVGLPNMVGRNKTTLFGYLKDIMQAPIQGWDKKMLSKGGKEILLKTVAQTLPNYAMNVFLLPLDLCQQLERLMCKFWWKTNSKKDRKFTGRAGRKCVTGNQTEEWDSGT